MKKKAFPTKLKLQRQTMANLNHQEMLDLKGGGFITRIIRQILGRPTTLNESADLICNGLCTTSACTMVEECEQH